MNGLSWLIYAADFLPSIGAFLKFVTVIFGILTVAGTVAFFIIMTENADRSQRRRNEGELPPLKFGVGYPITALVLMIVFGLMTSFTPERRTVLLIAASEVGERALNSEAAAKIGASAMEIYGPAQGLLMDYIKKETLSIRGEIDAMQKQK